MKPCMTFRAVVARPAVEDRLLGPTSAARQVRDRFEGGNRVDFRGIGRHRILRIELSVTGETRVWDAL